MVYDVQQEVLWVAASDGKKRSETFEMRGPCELFGFGSGDFCEGPDAKDVQTDLTGRWVSFNMSSANDLCILEADKRLPEHIRKMDLFGKVPFFHDLFPFWHDFFHALIAPFNSLFFVGPWFLTLRCAFFHVIHG